MKLSYDADNQEIFANDSIAAEEMDYFTSAAKDKCIEFHTELARRVNGWDKLVAFVRSVADISCLDPNATVATDGVCLSCLAIKVLKEAGCE